ncbi:hypothetical protein [Dietzia timorensis]|uniref:Modification methylase AvaI n=1 Tax=Dietzia timorensis TaxID=499555 RepID=A0A173LIC6_9ACTN|nr:hypothetical protein [Dietzia timorensis]ANI91364.1 Modification methylase AvaI [Dietzia timorensis]
MTIASEEEIGSHETQDMSELRALNSEFNVVNEPKLATLVNSLPSASAPFQRWLKYREGYAPEIVDRAIAESEKSASLPLDKGTLLDPFSGGGTSLVVARRHGLDSLGYEVNPVIAQLSRAKTHNYSSTDFLVVDQAIADIRQLTDQSPQAKTPELKILQKVFRPDVLAILLSMRYVIDGIENYRARDLLKVAWVSILEGVSNTFKEGNGIKYRNRKRTKNGYVQVPWEQVPGYLLPARETCIDRFINQIDMMINDVQSFPANGIEPAIRERSSVASLSEIESNSIDVSVFSPPYCNNFNYFKAFKIELWMGGYVENYSHLKQLTDTALRSHVELDLSELNDQQEETLPTELLSIVSTLRSRKLWSRKLPDSVLAYFFDMHRIINEVNRVLKPGALAHIVVGNSAYAGLIVPTDLFIASMARELGMTVERIEVARALTTSPQQRRLIPRENQKLLRESVLVLRSS